MGMCKGCGEVFNTNSMVDGYCENCIASKQNESSIIENQKKEENEECTKSNKTREGQMMETNTNTNHLKVSVVDIKMPFWSMVIFMIKWTLASIPAFIILCLLCFFLFFKPLKSYYDDQIREEQYRYIMQLKLGEE
jgi:ABC-type bacteriocin/lantibiotic exporter with double-glycine peptidase domain